jgi:hypothetical protein
MDVNHAYQDIIQPMEPPVYLVEELMYRMLRRFLVVRFLRIKTNLVRLVVKRAVQLQMCLFLVP